jgi:DNA polymerase III gamma/tau subunit
MIWPLLYKSAKRIRVRKMSNWNEQLRPQKVDDIVGNKQFCDDMRHWIETNEYPPAVLYLGPPGTGKTSAANVFANTVLGANRNGMNLLWTNASDERGINYVRDELKLFCRLKGIGTDIKVIVLDEFDGFTIPAQQTLRGIMEQYANRVIFILTANDGGKIHDAIKSRCRTYTFERVRGSEGAKHLSRLDFLPTEWVQNYPALVESFDGDLRESVNYLTSLKRSPDALDHIENASDGHNWWEDVSNNKFNDLRESLHERLNNLSGRTQFMYNVHRYVSKFFDKDAETAFSIIFVWGQMMEIVHDFIGSDESYVDVFVARLKKELEE